MLVICSNGLSSDKLLSEVKNKITGTTAALVVTGDPEYKEKDWNVPRCKNELEQLGLTVSFFDLDFDNPNDLLKYDVVEFIGGNPFYLLDRIRKIKCENVLKEIVDKKVLIGWCAAALCFSPSIELINIYSPELNFVNLTDFKGLSLTDIIILPHYSKFINKFDRFEERCQEYEEKNNIIVVRLNDGEGIIITNEVKYVKEELVV